MKPHERKEYSQFYFGLGAKFNEGTRKSRREPNTSC
jgi:hypothetical protein